MKETKCEAVRRELEESMLDDECSSGATQHLRECGECRQFHQQQTKLRQIVGSLGTVEAPADFDFRLRARLANESSSAGFHLRSMPWSFATQGFAAAVLVLLLVGGVFYFLNKPAQQTQVAEQKVQPVAPAPKPSEPTDVGAVTPWVANADSTPRKTTVERRAPSKPRPSLATVDSAVERPVVISNSQLHSAIFPIDASLEPLRVSLDDGRGNARTISVPTITFGSQRVLPNANQLAKKDIW